MAGNTDVVPIDKFLGLRNAQRPERLPFGSLVQADDINIFDDGSIELREGFSLSTSFTSLTAAYSTCDGNRLYVVDNGDLKRVYPDFTTVVLKSGISSGIIYWAESADKVFFSGASQGVIHHDQVFDWGLPKPNQPILSVVSGGVSAGEYRVTYVYVSDIGEQGAAATPASVVLSDNEAINITVEQKIGFTVIVFITSTDRNIFYKYINTSDSVIIWDGPISDLTNPIEEVQLYSGPPNNFTNIEFHDSKMWGVEYSPSLGKSYLFWSEPFWFGLFDLYNNFLSVSGEIRDILSISGGLLINTDRQIHLLVSSDESGGTGQLTLLFEYGVAPGQSMFEREDGQVFIWSKRGIIVGPPFKNVTEEKVSVAPGERCYAHSVQQDGANRMLVLVDDQDSGFNEY